MCLRLFYVERALLRLEGPGVIAMHDACKAASVRLAALHPTEWLLSRMASARN